jgi:hypothetical protein
MLLLEKASQQPARQAAAESRSMISKKDRQQHTHTNEQRFHLTSGAEERSRNATSHSRATVSNGMLLLAKPPSSQPGSGCDGSTPSDARCAVSSGKCSDIKWLSTR